jgi:hypothetical protein
MFTASFLLVWCWKFLEPCGSETQGLSWISTPALLALTGDEC